VRFISGRHRFDAIKLNLEASVGTRSPGIGETDVSVILVL